MKAWRLNAFGLENLRLEETPTPTPAAGEILVRVSAVSLDFRDKAIIDGFYEPQKLPEGLIPAADAAGEIAAIGSGVAPPPGPS